MRYAELRAKGPSFCRSNGIRLWPITDIRIFRAKHHRMAEILSRSAARLVAAATVAMWCGHAAAAEPLQLRYGQANSAAHSIFSLPVAVAERAGLFAREGLRVDIVIPIPGGADRMIAALHDDWADVTHVATPFLIRAALADSDAVAVAAEFKNPIYSLVAKPAIKSYADLRLKLIGLADETGTISISMRKLLAAHGLNRGSYAVKVEEGTPQRWYCLRLGDCDAVVLGQPQDLQAIEAGFRLLGRSDEAVPDFLYTVSAARRSWAAAHPDAMVRFVRAMAAALRFIRDPAHRGDVVAIIGQTTGASEAIAGATLDLFFQGGRDVLPQRGEIDLEGLRQVIAMMADAALLKPPLPPAERFVDLQYLRAAGVQ
jgi:ABC-type nitrate/sulfonate/bicarbonate transport system substrate-binding protein